MDREDMDLFDENILGDVEMDVSVGEDKENVGVVNSGGVGKGKGGRKKFVSPGRKSGEGNVQKRLFVEEEGLEKGKGGRKGKGKGKAKGKGKGKGKGKSVSPVKRVAKIVEELVKSSGEGEETEGEETEAENEEVGEDEEKKVVVEKKKKKAMATRKRSPQKSKKKKSAEKGKSDSDDEVVEQVIGGFMSPNTDLVIKRTPRKRKRPATSISEKPDNEEDDGAKESPLKKKKVGKVVKKKPVISKKAKSKPSKSTTAKKVLGMRKRPINKKPTVKKDKVAATKKGKAKKQTKSRKKEKIDSDDEDIVEDGSRASSEDENSDGDDEVHGDEAPAGAKRSRSNKRTDLGFVGYSGGEEAVMTHLDHAIRMMGGYNTVRDDNVLPNIFVVGNERRRTASLLRAIAGGVWIVKLQWVLDSITKERWLPLDKYEAVDMYAGARRAREARENNTPGLLPGIRITIQGELKVSNAKVSGIVARAGGRVVPTYASQSSSRYKPDYVIRGDLKGEPAKDFGPETKQVALEWLFDSVEAWELKDPNSYPVAT